MLRESRVRLQGILRGQVPTSVRFLSGILRRSFVRMHLECHEEDIRTMHLARDSEKKGCRSLALAHLLRFPNHYWDSIGINKVPRELLRLHFNWFDSLTGFPRRSRAGKSQQAVASFPEPSMVPRECRAMLGESRARLQEISRGQVPTSGRLLPGILRRSFVRTRLRCREGDLRTRELAPDSANKGDRLLALAHYDYLGINSPKSACTWGFLLVL